MVEVVYISSSKKEAVEFINDLIFDLKKIGIGDIKHGKRENFIIVSGITVRGISVCRACNWISRNHIKYFIDGIDMKNYENASERQIDSLFYRTREIMSHFREDTKQLNGKDELIEILMEKAKESYDKNGRNCRGLGYKLKPCQYIDKCDLCIWYSSPDIEKNYCVGFGQNPLKCKRDNPNFKPMTKKQFLEMYKKMPGRTNNVPLMDLYELAKIYGIVKD